MAKWLVQGNNRSIISGEFSTIDKLDVGNWLLKWNSEKGHFYISKVNDFKLPSKIYGNINNEVKRYLNTFQSKNKNIGIILNGLPGSGKTLTAKSICIESKLPVIIISQHFRDANFHSFLNDIQQEVVIFIDEFEKIFPYDYDDELNSPQNKLLSVLEGAFESKKLFVLTSNEASDISKYLKNRPGRIRYWKDYNGLPRDIINEIILNTLINTEYIESLTKNLDIIGEISYDMLTSIIEEMNMYDCTDKEALNTLNITPGSTRFKVEYKEKGIGRSPGEIWVDYTSNHPLVGNNFNVYLKNKEGNNKFISFNIIDCTYVIEGDVITIITPKEQVITFTKSSNHKFAF